MSTAFQLTSGPESTQRLAGFYTSAPDTRPEEFNDVYPDFGSLSADAPAAAALRHGEHWKFSIFWADAAYYVMQAKQPGLSCAPYKYRFLPTWIVGSLSAATGLSVERVFTLFNACVALLTAMLFESYLRRTCGLASVWCLLGGVLFLASASIVGTLTYPMLEPASMLLSCLLFMTAANRSVVGFAITAIAAVATKEVLAFGVARGRSLYRRWSERSGAGQQRAMSRALRLSRQPLWAAAAACARVVAAEAIHCTVWVRLPSGSAGIENDECC